MKRLITAVTLSALLLTPVSAFAYRGGYYGGYHRGGNVAWGILGGIVGGVVLDRVLFPPPVIVRQPAYDPYPYGYIPEPYGAAYYRGGGYYQGGGYYPGGGYFRRVVRPRCHGGWRGAYRY